MVVKITPKNVYMKLIHKKKKGVKIFKKEEVLRTKTLIKYFCIV